MIDSGIILERDGYQLASETLLDNPLNEFGAAVTASVNRHHGKASFFLRDAEVNGVKVNAEDVLRFGPYAFRVLSLDGWLVKVALVE